MDNENVEDRHLCKLYTAPEGVLYITMSHQILDDRIFSALCPDAKIGVDARIAPHISDHTLVSLVTNSYYRTVLSSCDGFIESFLLFLKSADAVKRSGARVLNEFIQHLIQPI